MRIPGILNVKEAKTDDAVAIIADSPHSGRTYPDDFAYVCDKYALQNFEDRYVDELIMGLPDLGVTTLAAEFPRTYIDPNRADNDLTPDQLDTSWHREMKPSRYCERGAGLIWSSVVGQNIYANKLTAQDVCNRLDFYYWPYLETLRRLINQTHERFDRVYHLNFHSMPPHVNDGRDDIILGNHNGTSADAVFTDMIAQAFRACGLTVGINDPYKGANITKTFGNPDDARHSLQIEINKALYLKPDLISRDDDRFVTLQNTIDAVVQMTRDYVSKTD